MSLSNVVRRLSAAELAREPRSLALIAFYDGWGQATGLPPREYPRLITTEEARHWREGWAEGKAAQMEQRLREQIRDECGPVLAAAVDRMVLHGT